MKSRLNLKLLNLKWLMAAITCSATVIAQAGTVWDEAINGDLSGDWLAPTPLALTIGSNIVNGLTGNFGQGVDRDYFTFAVPAGAQLTSLTLLGNTAVSGSVSFIGIEAGAQFTPPATTLPTDLLGFAHYGNDQIGTNMLPSLIFADALPSGTYSVWIQDTGGPASYGFDFDMTAVPVPGAAPLLLSGLLGLTTWRRRARG